MQIYVCENRDCSDRYVVGVFSSREAIEEYAAMSGQPMDEFIITKCEIDEALQETMGPMWRVAIRSTDGEIKCEQELEPRLRHPKRCAISYEPRWSKPLFINVFSPVSKEHAIKVAVERQKAWLRDPGPPGYREEIIEIPEDESGQ